MKSTTKTTKSVAIAGKSSGAFSDEELAAMKDRAEEIKSARRKGGKGDGEQEVLTKIAEVPESDRSMAERIHALVKANAPTLSAKTWYGMPAYANADGKIVCFFQSAEKFKYRYATFGFNEAAKLDDGHMWPTAFALTSLTAADEARIAELVGRRWADGLPPAQDDCLGQDASLASQGSERAPFARHRHGVSGARHRKR